MAGQGEGYGTMTGRPPTLSGATGPAPGDPADGNLPALLLRWYDSDRRDLPWRSPPGAPPPDPYAVWLSEVMLQQTGVATVAPYYRAFLARWPDVAALAAAPQEAVMAAWAGLGYYSRARNLLRCAQHVAGPLGGRFPETEAGLRELPGIGPYTAAAIAAIAFDRSAVVVDGNVERVVARLFAVTQPLPAAKPELRALAARLTPRTRPGDFAQAMMDLGATVCTPRRPACNTCPLAACCRGRAAGLAADLPRKAAKAPKPLRHGMAFWLRRRGDGAVLLERRPDRGLLGGMLGLPGTPWRPGSPWALAAVGPHLPAQADWRLLPGKVGHVFTHFALDLAVAVAEVPATPGPLENAIPDNAIWLPPEAEILAQLPTVMRKAARFALQPEGDAG